MTEKTVTEIVILKDVKLPAPKIVVDAIKADFEEMFGKIRKEIKDFVPDLSTKKGRDEIASLAYKISRTKTALGKAADDVIAGQKKIVKAVGDECKAMRETLDTMRDEVRTPLEEWKAEEAEKKKSIKDAFTALDIVIPSAMSSENITVLLNDVADRTYDSGMFGEWYNQVEDKRDEAIKTLNAALDDCIQREKNDAELEELRAFKAERDKAAAEKAEQEVDTIGSTDLEFESVAHEDVATAPECEPEAEAPLTKEPFDDRQPRAETPSQPERRGSSDEAAMYREAALALELNLNITSSAADEIVVVIGQGMIPHIKIEC